MVNRSSSPFDSERIAAVSLEEQLGRWPRRLLHVPSMTSFCWQPGNRYGPAASPRYNANSYTWGRFREIGESSHTRAIDIKGITWSIPKIQKTRFGVHSFEKMIREAVSAPNDRVPERKQENEHEGVEFLWVDIACIDQNGTIDSGLEIGRQAHIFRNAQRVYVWLACTSLEELHELRHFSNFWMVKAGDYRRNDTTTQANVDDAQNSLERLRKEPWFSSVWTLQEAYLRRDAVLVCEDATSVVRQGTGTDGGALNRKIGGNEVFQLQHFLAGCQGIWSFCWQAFSHKLQVESLTLLLRNLGIVGLTRNDPMRLYATAASRKPSKELDSVYGIQQVFNLRLGSSDPHKTTILRHRRFTLEQLEDELGEALMRINPVLSQMFQHSSSSLPIGKRWRVSRDIETHSGNNNTWNSSIYDPRCKLSTYLVGDFLCGRFQGNVCDFTVMQHAWETRHKYLQDLGISKQPEMEYQPGLLIRMDMGTDLLMRIPVWSLQPAVDSNSVSTPAADQIYALKVAELLAKTTAPGANPTYDDKRSMKVLHLGEHKGTAEKQNECHLGLLLFPRVNEPREIWRRVGICAWLGLFSIWYGPSIEDDSIEPFDSMAPQGVESEYLIEDSESTRMPLYVVREVETVLSGKGDAWNALSGLFG